MCGTGTMSIHFLSLLENPDGGKEGDLHAIKPAEEIAKFTVRRGAALRCHDWVTPAFDLAERNAHRRRWMRSSMS